VFVHVFKTGFFSLIAHDHRIVAPIAGGTVTLGEHPSVAVTIDTGNLRVLDPELPADTREEIEQTMLGPKVLDAERYPAIRFASNRVTVTGQQSWRVAGSLTLHGRTRPVTLRVVESDGVYKGAVEIRQSDFGITPVRIARGVVSVKDAVRIRFEIRLEDSAREKEAKTGGIP
jgi:polyisoprenoid-binding protein YceI